MNRRSIHPILSTFLFLSGVVLGHSVGAAPETLQPPNGEALTVNLRAKPMPDTGSSHLGKILNRYYTEGLGGSDHWETITSLKVSGSLKLESGEFDFAAYQRKPDLIKITINGKYHDLVLAYDGRQAWRQVEASGQAPVLMDALEARRFIHSAHFGNHLLYPYTEGKRIDYIDTVPVEGTICHQIRVTLPTEYQVDYFIDVRSYLEIKVVNTDLRTGTVSSIVYEDYIREYGMPIAKRVDSYEDGKWVSQLELDEVRVNAGVMPWMFAMPE